MQISKRLEAVADMVTPGCHLADIGTDHAYIPIYLAQAGKIARAIAMDVNKGPLERAKEHICSYGLEQMIETRLSDGLDALQPGEADQIVIAGMGGPLTVRILRDGAEKLTKECALILQPQSEIQSVRAYLKEKKYCILCEEMICEDGKYYPMMKAVRKEMLSEWEDSWYRSCEKEDTEHAGHEEQQPDACANWLSEDSGKNEKLWEDAQFRYGPLLIERRHPVLYEYLKREQELNRRILASLNGQESEAAAARRSAVEYELKMIDAVKALYQK